MAIDQIIASGVQPQTQINTPMQTIGGLMQLRGQMADQALREAQMSEVRQRQQNEKLKGDQINLELKDANNFAEIQKDPSLMRQFAETGDVSMFHQKGISPAFIEKLVEGRGKRITGIQTETVTGQAIKKNATEQMIATGDGIMAPMAGGKPVDIATANSRYQGALPRLKELALLRGDDPAKLPGSIASLEQIQGVLSGLNLDAGLYDAGLKRTEETAKRDKAVADVAKATADAAIAGKVNVGTSGLGVSENQRIQQQSADATRTEQKRRDDEIYRHNLQTERAAFLNASKEAKPKSVPATIIKGLAANTQMISTIQQALDALDPAKGGYPDAVGFKGYISDTILNRMDEKGTTARGLLARVAAQEFHDFSGAAVTASEAARLKPFLPAVNDDINTVRNKLESLKKQVEGLNSFQREAYAEGYQALPGDKAAAKAGGTIKARDPQGQLHEAPAGTALPAGWKLEP